MKKNLVLFYALLISGVMYSQQGPGNNNGNGPPFPCPPHNPVCGGQPGLPINGALYYLIAAGVIYGIREIKKNKK